MPTHIKVGLLIFSMRKMLNLVLAYYLGNTCADFPFSVLQVVLFCVTVYFSVGLRLAASAFFLYFLIAVLALETSLALAQVCRVAL